MTRTWIFNMEKKLSAHAKTALLKKLKAIVKDMGKIWPISICLRVMEHKNHISPEEKGYIYSYLLKESSSITESRTATKPEKLRFIDLCIKKIGDGNVPEHLLKYKKLKEFNKTKM